ncbi:glycerate kinase [Corynebacterium variabile]|uniref:glycerate kinase n=1 Tax=Corynebacterium variabile TaxID=1727 RepID=UPI003F95F0C3
MKIVIAPDSFKESLTAVEACTAMAAGVRDILPDAEIIEIPMADGGEGTAHAFAAALDLEERTTTVTGPLGDPVEAHWCGDGTTAVVELAEAAGIHLVAPEHRDIWAADTRGVGHLLNAALDTAPQKLIIGLGGSVTTDGGLGLLAALGVTAVDAAGEPTDLRHAARITGERDPRWNDIQVVIAGDVDNPLCGPTGAAAVFGPQKGATDEDIPELDKSLHHWADLLADFTGTDGTTIRDTPGAGAAGGVGAALLSVLHAEMRSGADLLLDLVDFRGKVEDADLVLTGEGTIDAQTGYGKAPARVAHSAGNVPVVAFGGRVDATAESPVPGIFIDTVAISDPASPLEENLVNAADSLRKAVASWLAAQ